MILRRELFKDEYRPYRYFLLFIYIFCMFCIYITNRLPLFSISFTSSKKFFEKKKKDKSADNI